MLSVVFPILNEIKNPYFWESLAAFSEFKNVEVVIVDGGSSDGTLQKLEALNHFVLHTSQDRASRINRGVYHSCGDTILVHHPRSLISIAGVNELLLRPPCSWGGFKHQFDWQHPLLSFTSWYSNYGRKNLWSVLYLDHCIFFPRHVIKDVFPLPEVEIFEDTHLSYGLRKKLGRPKILPFKVTTSAIRFKKSGPVGQSLLNQKMKLKFHLGASAKEMNSQYESRVRLNSK